MTCKDCIHSGLCYKENEYENFPDRCGEFIDYLKVSEDVSGEWVGINEYLKHIEETTGEKYKTSGLYNGRLFCNRCWKMSELMIKTNFCYECGARMEVDNE